MSGEQLPNSNPTFTSYNDYAEFTLYNELVRMQNSGDWSSEPIYINGSFQELCAKSLVSYLQKKLYFQKFGGNTVKIVMDPTKEDPYMSSIGMQIIIET